jgi:hypothetical protein
MTARELLGLGAPRSEAERRRAIPTWWLLLSVVLAWAVERVVEPQRLEWPGRL